MALFRERFVVRFLHIGTTAAVVAVGLAFAYDSFSTPLTRLLEALFPQGISLVLLVLALIESLWFRPGDVPCVVAASAPEDLKPVVFLTNYVFLGRHAPFFVGLEKGFYREAGFDIRILPSTGSGFPLSPKRLGSAGR